MAKIKPSWVKTDIPKSIKVKYHWQAMVETTTYESWEQALTSMDWQDTDSKYARMSRETYKRLQQEILEMPSAEVNTLPSGLKFWVEDIKSIKQVAKGSRQALQIEKQPVSMSGQAESIRNHDKAIFRRSNAILSEQKLRDFLWPLDGGPPIYYYGKADSIDEFLRFFSYVGNQYVDREAMRLCNNLCDALRKLRTFLSEQFRPYDRFAVCDCARLIPEELSHAYYSEGRDPEEEPKIYWKYFDELQKLKGTCEDCFKQYRVYFRDNLLL